MTLTLMCQKIYWVTKVFECRMMTLAFIKSTHCFVSVSYCQNLFCRHVYQYTIVRIHFCTALLSGSHKLHSSLLFKLLTLTAFLST